MKYEHKLLTHTLATKNNDMENFEFDKPDQWEGLVCGNDIMRTSSLTIQNGKIIESECKGNFTFNNRFDNHMVLWFDGMLKRQSIQWSK